MTDLAWSQDDTANIRSIIVAALADATITVFDGRASYGSEPPFVTCWQLDPEQWGAGLAEECWGLAQQRWQVSGHGRTQMEARWLVETITGHDWGAGWELVEVGPMVEDTTDAPPTWFVPVTFVYRGMS